ncbi:MAG: tRNA (N(6)-L-threonylcarbamoyladenosine(37)-C(2))-methylthiotransferase MtaB [Elusimicrobia bacterium]|nr:tRNA (N(6)-L-threonylcarbamoyladenosine(37)-C(2))-methylthiotransferase MtaB [Elusimicrobiota bacterium]
MRIFFKTFGCRVNQYETEALRERLLSGGASLAEDFESADLCVVNTCTVTGEADKDALALLRRIGRRNPSARVIVTGCLATRAQAEILKASPSAVVVGNSRKDDIPALLGCESASGFAGIAAFSGHSRAFLKAQDGCDMKCSYCVVPSVRPKLWSKPYPEIEREARGLIEGGFAELVLCGIRLGRYSSEDAAGREVDIVGLIERLIALPGDFRIRLSSLEIMDVNSRFLDLAASSAGRLCPSFHLPVQSGSESVLKRMRRSYTAAFYARRIESLRARLPGAGLFTDVLAGFPGESEEEFLDSVDFIGRMRFSGLHVFRFSRRSGTPAAAMQGRLPESALKERSDLLRAMDGKLRAAFAASAVGSRRQVVVEERSKSVTATTDHFLRVFLDKDPGPGLHWAEVLSSSGASARAALRCS